MSFQTKFLLVAMMMLYQSCQHASKEFADLSHVEETVFQQCQKNAEGGGSLLVLKHKQPILKSDFDWILKKNSLACELSDPLGGTLLGLSVNRKEMKQYGQLASGLLRMETDRDGKFLIEDYFSGLYLEEIFCLLQGTIPTQWSKQVLDINATKNPQNSLKFLVSSQNRDIVLQRIKDHSVCAEIKWRLKWYLPRQILKWCRIDKENKLILEMPNEIKVELQRPNV